MNFCLLGPVGAAHQGVHIDLGARQQRTVMAILLLSANQLVTVDKFGELLWPDSFPRNGRNTLQVYISRLRRLLSGIRNVDLASDGDAYILKADPACIDVNRFVDLINEARRETDLNVAATHFESALALWHGPALANVTEPCARRFGAPLEEARRLAFRDYMQLLVGAGRFDQAISELVGAVMENVLDESLAELYMRALYATGQQARALEVYQRVADALKRDLGVEPYPALRQLHVQMLRHCVGEPVG